MPSRTHTISTHPDDGPVIVVNPAGATRTYQAVQFTANKRFARRWFFAGSYTLSRLRGNYVGLYDADNDQRNPNQSTQYDAPGIMVNRNGPLPNDRPHLIRLDGYYTQPFGHSSLTAGLGFCRPFGSAVERLGRLRVPGQTTTHTSSRADPWAERPLSRVSICTSPIGAACSASCPPRSFFDIFNLFNQRTVLTQDQEYTADQVTPIPCGTKADLNNLPPPAQSTRTPTSSCRLPTRHPSRAAWACGCSSSIHVNPQRVHTENTAATSRKRN